jgi:hypothetical protein
MPLIVSQEAPRAALLLLPSAPSFDMPWLFAGRVMIAAEFCIAVE